MKRAELEDKIAVVEKAAAFYYDKFETADNVASELHDVMDDWESDEEIREPDIDDYGANQIEDYHFDQMAYEEAQTRIAEYPDTVESILSRMP